MKHITAGLKARLGMQERGDTFISLEVRNSATGFTKSIRFLIDTGFNGFLQISAADVTDLGLTLKEESESIISDGSRMKTRITTTPVRILGNEISDFPIQVVPNGLSLIGTQLLRRTKTMLIFDYRDGYVTLTQNEDLAAIIKVHVEKYAQEEMGN